MTQKDGFASFLKLKTFIPHSLWLLRTELPVHTVHHFPFVSLRKVSLFWNTVKLSYDECIFFFWVKSIRCYDNIGVDAQPYTQSHSSLQPTCQRETTLFYLWLMSNTTLPLACLRLLSVIDLNVILIHQWCVGLISCWGELCSDWALLNAFHSWLIQPQTYF